MSFMNDESDDEELCAISLRTRSKSKLATPKPGAVGNVGNIFEVRAEAALSQSQRERPASTGRDDPVARSLLTTLDAEEDCWEPIEGLESGNLKKRKKPPLGGTPARKQTKPRPAETADGFTSAPVARVPLTSLSVAFGSLGFNPPRIQPASGFPAPRPACGQGGAAPRPETPATPLPRDEVLR